jgi:hypothetical protein
VAGPAEGTPLAAAYPAIILVRVRWPAAEARKSAANRMRPMSTRTSMTASRRGMLLKYSSRGGHLVFGLLAGLAYSGIARMTGKRTDPAGR